MNVHKRHQLINTRNPGASRAALVIAVLGFVACGAEQDPDQTPNNQPPIASAQVTGPTPVRNSLIAFDARQSSDFESTVAALEFDWVQTVGPPLQFLMVDDNGLTHPTLYAVVGAEPVELEVTVSDQQSSSSQRVRLFDADCDSASDPDLVCVVGLLDNTPPNAGVSVTEITENTSAMLDASRTVDQETPRATLYYRWEVKSAESDEYTLHAEGGAITTTLQAEQPTDVRLTVSDGEFADALVARLFDDSCTREPDEDHCLLALEDNVPPLVAINAITDIPESSHLIVDASRTTDVETASESLTFHWRQTSGDPLDLDGQTAESALVIGTEDIPVTLELDVSDGTHTTTSRVQVSGPDCVIINDIDYGCGSNQGLR